jgi:hypothetical protein
MNEVYVFKKLYHLNIVRMYEHFADKLILLHYE